MEELINSVESALNADILYPAFITCLSLIDICAYIEYKKEPKHKQRYIIWFEKNMPDYTEIMSGEEAYALRCVILHNGEQVPEQYNSRIRSMSSAIVLDLYLLNSYGSNKLRINSAGAKVITPEYPEGLTIPSLVNLGIPEFCRDVISAIRNWVETTSYDLVDSSKTFSIAKEQIQIGGAFYL